MCSARSFTICRVGLGPGAVVAVIDDDRRCARRYARIVEERGYVAVVGSIGPASIADLSRTGFDALVCEVRSKKHGWAYNGVDELARRWPGARIVVATARGSLAGEIEAADRGVDVYVDKPVDARRLIASIESASPFPPPLPQVPSLSLAAIEWEYVHAVLCARGWSVSASAETLGVHRATLIRRLDSPPGHRQSPRWLGLGAAVARRLDAARPLDPLALLCIMVGERACSSMVTDLSLARLRAVVSRAALDDAGGNVAAAARRLQIAAKTLRRYLRSG
jgi:two-component system response regulator RegA